MDLKATIIDHSRRHSYQELKIFPTLEAHRGTGGGNVPLVIVEKARPVCVLATSCYDAPITDGSVSPTLCARAGTGGNQLPLIVLEKNTQTGRRFQFRRITPTECARLQGFPDWWTDGTDGSDSAIYKMWGNGIALPCAADVIGRIAKEMERDSDDITLEG